MTPRLRALLGILAFLVGLGVPFSFMDQALGRTQKELGQVQSDLIPLRKKLQDLQAREKALADRQKQLDNLDARLLHADPFAGIRSALDEAARKSGAALGALTIEGAAPVSGVPGLVRYKTTVQVSGSRAEFLEFLRLLEHHALLIEIPEISLSMPVQGVPAQAPPPAVQAPPAAPLPGQAAPPPVRITAEVQQVLVLGFYGKASQ